MSPTRREQQREETFAAIVATARTLLAEGAELSLRAIAGRMGITAPALYRYVSSYQELVDLVAFDVDQAATATFRAAADALPADDLGGRLVASVTEFRMWALGNPIADAACVRREALTVAASGHLFTDQLRALWERDRFPVPALGDLPDVVVESVRDPLIPADTATLADADRGLVWVYMQGWTRLYGVVALEVFGHMDPRVIASGEMFLATVRDFAPLVGQGHDVARLEGIVRARLGR